MAMHPPKLRKGKPQAETDKAHDTSAQANLRIHVERFFGRCKAWKSLSADQKILTLDMLGAVFRVIAYLTNFKLPLVSKEWREATARRVSSGSPRG